MGCIEAGGGIGTRVMYVDVIYGETLSWSNVETSAHLEKIAALVFHSINVDEISVLTRLTSICP